MRTISIAKLLIVFAIAFSLASLTGPMSSHFILPSVPSARAVPQSPCAVPTGGGGCSDVWVPAGSSEDTFVATIFTDEQAEFTNIQSASPTIDFTDWQLTPALTPTFTTSNNFQITSTISANANFEVQFMLANNFWGVNMNFGNDPNGAQIRQGVWHMLDTANFAANEPSLHGQGVALDSPNPTDNIGGLPSVNPCGWDTTFPETGPQCVVGAAGGTAYHLAAATGANSISWLQAPGSLDLDAAAAHFVAAGIATGCDGGSGVASCIASHDSILSGISSAAAAHAPNFFVRNDNPPRLDLGNSLAEQICYIFTGSYNVPCTYLGVTRGPITAFPGFTTSTTSVNLSWGLYTAAYGGSSGPSPFDATFYLIYNSNFASVIPSIASPTGTCASSGVPTVSAPDYMYLCSPAYDSLTNQMEFANCLTVTGDPVVGQTSNNSTGTCSAGGLSAIGAGLEAENLFGRGAYTMEVFGQNEQFGYLNNGWIRVDNNVGIGLPNFFTWLNAWNPSPAVSGTIRQAFKQTTSSASPFIDQTVWDNYIDSAIYDSLMLTNPLSGGQLMNWMALSVQQLPNTAITYSLPANTQQTFRFTLRSDLFFQDGTKVTAFDVAFSLLAGKGTGAFTYAGVSPMTGMTVLGPSQFDINVKGVGPFTLLNLGDGPTPILPGAYWTNAGSSAWTSAISTCTATNAPCYPAQYTLNSANPTTTNCAITCVFPASTMNVKVSQTTASYDPIANHTLVGAGPWECGPVTSSGSSTTCSSSGAQNPPVGGSYILSRFGKGLAPGSSIQNIYFRSQGNLALYLWSLNTGDITADFLNFSVVASCFGAAVASTGPCVHFQQGIGGNGVVGLSQVAIVNRFVGLNWIAPFNWHTSPPAGIVPLNPVLYENTVTLNPASVVGCPSGYDC